MNQNLPKELIQSFKNSSTIDIELFERAHNEEPTVSIRGNPLKPISKFDEMEAVPWSRYGYYLSSRPNFTADPLLHAGCYYVQEASSMFLETALTQLVDFDKPIKALDLCAAPGGKSTLIASLLQEHSLLIANEVIHNRASVLSENLCKWGRINTWVTNNDPIHFIKLNSIFDVILVDAPCSGSGLFRKIPAFVDDWNLDTVHLCAQRQKRILQDVYNSLKDEGILVYMTCSFCEEENEDMVDYILQEFNVTSCALELDASWNIVETESAIHKGKGYRFFPHLLKGEGFFLACFKKHETQENFKKAQPQKIKKQTHYVDLLSGFIDMNNKETIIQKENIFVVNSLHSEDVTFFSKHLKLIKKGFLAGQVIRNELIPDHELAMFEGINPDVKSIELSLEKAIAYLQKESIQVDSQQKGWQLVRFEGYNLGWIKNLGNRVNNYYPIQYRILNKNILTT